MDASLYIYPDSFKHNGTDSKADVMRKLNNTKEWINTVHKKYGNDNKFFVDNSEFKEIEIFEGTKICDIMNNFNSVNLDYFTVFSTLLSYFKKCKISNDELHKLTPVALEDESISTALVCLDKPNDNTIPSNRMLSDFPSWLTFRREHLGKYPQNPDFFIYECSRYFEILIIHPDNNNRVKPFLRYHSIGIVNCLSALNDHFIPEYKSTNIDTPHFLPHFAISHSLNGASLEGKKKKIFDFYFKSPIGGSDIKKYCEAHLKINKNDSGITVEKKCRIHFALPDKKGNEEKIYVGYIGEHT